MPLAPFPLAFPLLSLVLAFSALGFPAFPAFAAFFAAFLAGALAAALAAVCGVPAGAAAVWRPRPDARSPAGSALGAAGRAVTDRDVAGLDLADEAPPEFAGAAASDFAASLSDVTADSRAFVAVEMAVRALVSVFAESDALVAAAFSRVAAELTLVAAEATARGVAVPPLPVALPLADLLPAVLVPVLLVPAGLVVVRFAGPVPAPVRRPATALRAGAAASFSAFVAALFLGGTDLPPIWISYGVSYHGA